MNILQRLLPRSLTGQLILGLTCVLLVAQGIVIAIFFQHQTERFERTMASFLVQRVALVSNLLTTTPPAMHQEVLKVASAPGLRFRVSRTLPGLPPAPVFHSWLKPHLSDHGLHEATIFRLPAHQHVEGRVGGLVAVPVQIERIDAWLTLTAHRKGPPPWPRYTTISFLIAAAGGILVITLLVRRAMRPLKTLSIAAEKLGRGEAVEPIAEKGPSDIRSTIAAFNQMQDRLHRFVADRTRMVAAVSHDLRSPITALRLRAEMVDQDDLRERMVASLDEMQQMMEATLAFAREDATQEASKETDLTAMVGEVVQSYRDQGIDVVWHPEAPEIYVCRPMALKRAVDNLLANAIAYGGSPRVLLEGTSIAVQDNGPGIPEDKLEHVFEPFARLEDSRNTATGGTGLGLAIVRTIATAHGGRVALRNMTEGGLEARLILPPLG